MDSQTKKIMRTAGVGLLICGLLALPVKCDPFLQELKTTKNPITAYVHNLRARHKPISFVPPVYDDEPADGGTAGAGDEEVPYVYIKKLPDRRVVYRRTSNYMNPLDNIANDFDISIR